MTIGMKSKKKEYGSIRVYHPEGQLMFVANFTKVNWYLSRNLAEVIEQEGEEIQAIKLKFVPKGYGQNLPFFLSPLKNICVVCGSSIYNVLTRHHVFPECYKKQLPVILKSKNHYDVFRMCFKHHNEYENHAQELKNKIAEELGVPSINAEVSDEIKLKRKVPGIAKIILCNRKNIPQERLDYLFGLIKSMTGVSEVTDEFLTEICEKDKREGKKNKKENPELLHGYQVMQKVTDIQGFVERWRNHFIEYANPQFLPDNWNVEEKNYIKKQGE